MRPSVRRMMLLGAVAILAALSVSGCQNPLDPIDKSAKIQGLTFIDFSATWERWDSDPEFDGVLFTLDYSNEFGDALSFHDKPHNVVIEFWTTKATGPEGTFKERDKLFFSKTIRFSNSDDDIRLPIEAYIGALRGSGLDLTAADIKCFVVVRVFPPQDFPRPELFVAQPDIVVFKQPPAEDTPNP